MTSQVSFRTYYGEFHGHPIRDLETIHGYLRVRNKEKCCVFFLGDSSLDNKYWFHEVSEAVNGYEEVIKERIMKLDVCYWVNRFAQERNLPMFCLNTGVEATTLNSRYSNLLAQDVYARDHLTQRDSLIVSVGGNDIALSPTLKTIVSMLSIIRVTSKATIQFLLDANPECGFCGKWSCTFCSWHYPFGLNHFVHLFKNRVESYIQRVCALVRPRIVLVCMIYYPKTSPASPSWADVALQALRYNTDPEKLQMMIRLTYKLGTSRIQLEGTKVIPIPLFEVLDAENGDDYRYRVEPSPNGGRKMAERFIDVLSSAGAWDNDETLASS